MTNASAWAVRQDFSHNTSRVFTLLDLFAIFLNPVIRFYMLQYVALRNLVRIRLCRWIMRVVARGHDCIRESHFAAAVGPIKLCLPIAQTIAVQYLQ